MNTKDNGSKTASKTSTAVKTGTRRHNTIKSARFTVRHRAGKTPLMMHDLTDCTGEGDCIHEQGIQNIEATVPIITKKTSKKQSLNNVSTLKVAKTASSSSSKHSSTVDAKVDSKVGVSTKTDSTKPLPSRAKKSENTSNDTVEKGQKQSATENSPSKNVVQLKLVKNVVENKRRIFTSGVIATLVAGVIAGSTFGFGKIMPPNTDIVTFVTGKMTDFHADQLNRQGKTTDAIAEYEKAIKQSPNDLTAYKQIATIHEIDTREFNKAIKVLKEALAINDSDADLYRLLAYAQLWTGQIADAAKSGQKAIDLRQGDAMAVSTMALIVASGGDLVKGKDLMQQAMNTDGHNSSVIANAALFNLAYAKDYSKAEELIRQAIKLSPTEPNYYWQLSSILKSQNKVDDAEAALRKALAMQSDNGYRAADLADYLSSDTVKKYSEAADMYVRAIAHGYSDGNVIGSLAAALFNAGKYSEAAIQYQKASELKPEIATYVLMVGRSQFEAKNYTAAKDAFTKLLAMDSSWTSYDWLGRANYALGDYSVAIGNFTTAVKLNNSNSTVYAYLAAAQDKAGDTVAAIGYSLQALNTDANDEFAWTVVEQIGNHLLSSNQKTLAVDFFTAATTQFPSSAMGRSLVVSDLSRIS